MFERLHHRRIASVLETLNAAQLAACGCWFGGGTAIAMRHGEYRESVNIDFLVSDVAGYRVLRQLLTEPAGLAGIAAPEKNWSQARDVRADQYGLRTLIEADGAAIKFEILRETRIHLDPPAEADRICGVLSLTPLDLAASKLLANSDRWADDGVLSRDLIDLAMMQPTPGLLRAAIAKASRAYGASIEADLAKAIAALRSRDGHLERCMQGMQMTLPRALMLKRILALQPR